MDNRESAAMYRYEAPIFPYAAEDSDALQSTLADDPDLLQSRDPFGQHLIHFVTACPQRRHITIDDCCVWVHGPSFFELLNGRMTLSTT